VLVQRAQLGDARPFPPQVASHRFPSSRYRFAHPYSPRGGKTVLSACCGNLSKRVFFTATSGISRALLCALGERDGDWPDMATYLERVAEGTASCAGKFGAVDFGYWAGLWHHLETFHPDFQAYFISLKSRREPDHPSAEQNRH
jgi:hypothetical protein